MFKALRKISGTVRSFNKSWLLSVLLSAKGKDKKLSLFATSKYDLRNIKMQPTWKQVAGLTIKGNCYLRCSVKCQDAGPQATASPFLNPDSNSNPQPENKKYKMLLPAAAPHTLGNPTTC